jgi:amino acid transporter
MTFFWRTRQTSALAFNVAFDVIFPLAAVAICAYTIYESFRSPGPSPNTWSPWIALGWLAFGLAVLTGLRAADPERVRAFGSILGQGEAEAPINPVH